jgi:hypothetical protein
MIIEIDVFSGRPNPRWELSPAEGDELLARLQEQSLPPGASPPPRAGYRGFIVYRPDAQGHPIAWLRVGGGAITVLAGAGVGTYSDIIGLENWLVGLARGAGFGALFSDSDMA